MNIIRVLFFKNINYQWVMLLMCGVVALMMPMKTTDFLSFYFIDFIIEVVKKNVSVSCK